MISKWIQFTVKAEDVDAFHAQILLLDQESKLELGCIQYSTYQCVDDPCIFTVLEVWENEAAFEAHRKAPHIASFKTKWESMILKKSALALKPVNKC